VTEGAQGLPVCSKKNVLAALKKCFLVWKANHMKIIPRWLANFGLLLNRLYYRQLFRSTYRGKRQSPAWFDHRIDLYYHWPHNLFWLERGILPRKHMYRNCRVLDLFCGDGFYPRYFYSSIAGHIDAVDKDSSAIAHAKRWHSHPKIKYLVLDAVTQDLPGSSYDVIVWFEAIEHLNEAEYAAVVRRVKTAMKETGVLMGSTPVVPAEQQGAGNWEHKHEFSSAAQLREFLSLDFTGITIDVTVYPVLGGGDRETAYFTLREPK
jgi:SAM-dependent methyltransferase